MPRELQHTTSASRSAVLTEAQQAFARFYTRCFWSSPRDLKIDDQLVPWVADQLRKHGDTEAFLIADHLSPCH